MEEYFEPVREAPEDQGHYSTALTNAAFTLALLSIGGCVLLYLNIPLGCMAIIFALLGRGDQRLSPRGKLAAMIGAATITFSIGSTAYTGYKVYTTPALRAQFEAALDFYSHYYFGDAGESKEVPNTDETGISELSMISEGGDAA